MGIVMASNINITIPATPIGENFAWRNWFQKLSNIVLGTMATQDHTNVNITGGSVNGVSITGTTIPASDVTGLGTMATQNSSGVSITGGSIDASIALTNSTASAATTGTNGATPAQVAGYVIVNIGGSNHKIPYYNI